MKLFLASGNLHKVKEFQDLSRGSGAPIDIVSAAEAGEMPAVREDTGTFLGNARKKALALRDVLPACSWVLADDSGLCVDALGGAPGVDSATYAGPRADDAANLAKLAAAMRGVADPGRGAHFACVLFLAGPGGVEEAFEGRCDGRLLREPRGSAGFGYDPLFAPAGHTRSFAELGAGTKAALSHRARAWAKLAAWCRGRGLSGASPESAGGAV
jgi:XTP/dITP diphosphohydrolase